MENVRLSRPAKVRIERAHRSATARVFVNGEDVSHHVSAVSWTMRAGKLPTATITFHDVEVEVEAEDADGENVAFVTEHPVRAMPITGEQWERLRRSAPGVVAAIEEARPVVQRAKAVPGSVLK